MLFQMRDEKSIGKSQFEKNNKLESPITWKIFATNEQRSFVFAPMHRVKLNNRITKKKILNWVWMMLEIYLRPRKILFSHQTLVKENNLTVDFCWFINYCFRPSFVLRHVLINKHLFYHKCWRVALHYPELKQMMSFFIFRRHNQEKSL